MNKHLITAIDSDRKSAMLDTNSGEFLNIYEYMDILYRHCNKEINLTISETIHDESIIYKRVYE